jgi:light-regulated signal transduction histidine kinase (bacteriophytochrome)
VGPGALAVLLSTAGFVYFFAEPIYSFYVSVEDLPYFLTFLLSAVVVGYFAAVRRRVEQDLRTARDHLQIEVDQRRKREEQVSLLNEELGKRASELESANKELESFAYSVSHDLRAPLRHIVGYAELLQKHSAPALDDKSQRYMRTIQDSARRMGALIDDLLSFSRVGRTETRKTVVSLDQLVREAISELAAETGGREIAWKIGALPACYGDRSMLKLVLQNLIANAVKFTRERERAEIEIGSISGKPDEIVIFVRDNGVGFDMRYVDKLFGVFQRLHPTEDFEGTGIGLASVQRIIHRHGGQVRAEGAPDRGATFYFSLPAARGTP